MRVPPADSTSPGEYYCAACDGTFSIGGACPHDGTRLIRLTTGVDPLLGRDLEGKYTILERLGHGGMGTVYRAEQRGLGREVAVKLVNAPLVANPDVIKRFLREARLASRLAHPNAVGVIDFGQADDGVCYLVMELVHGRTLDRVFDDEGAFAADRLVRIGMQICDALEGAHALQIIHRDLKPANVMLLDQGRDLVKVLDFGLAKSVASDRSMNVTTTGELLGTPMYMPPELARGESCDGRADLYSLGVMLYLLGSGRLPFQSTTPHELLAMHASEPAPPMSGVPQALADVVDRLLRKDPADRFQTARTTRDALEAALEQFRHTPVPFVARTSSPDQIGVAATTALAAPTLPDAARPVAGRRRWLAPLALVGVLAGVAALYAAATSRDDTSTVQAPAATVREPAPLRPPPRPEPAVAPVVDAAVVGEPAPAPPPVDEPPRPKTIKKRSPERAKAKPVEPTPEHKPPPAPAAPPAAPTTKPPDSKDTPF